MSSEATEPSSPPAPGDLRGASAAPLVSVLMITYNHERYIAEAIESVLAQRTSFPIELVIGEDCSKDRTRQIVLDYQSRFPDRVRVLANETNLGPQRNFGRTYEACRGKYVALLEGDDYWNSPDKLQLQVDFLEAHPDFVAAAHNAVVVDQRVGREAGVYSGHTTDRLGIDNFLAFNHVPTCSVLFRNRLVPQFPEWFFDVPAGDWVLHILHTRHGDMHYSPRPMAHYRSHPNGMWSGMSRTLQLRAEVDVYQHLLRELGPQYESRVRGLMSRRLLDLLYQYEKEGDAASARECLSKYVSLNAWRPAVIRPAVMSAAWRLLAPRTYAIARRFKSAIFGNSEKSPTRTLAA